MHHTWNEIGFITFLALSHIHIDIKYIIIHFIVMRYFVSDMQLHYTQCVDEQLQNIGGSKSSDCLFGCQDRAR
jgi:hypothetical protein